jgi:hypothetical protein
MSRLSKLTKNCWFSQKGNLANFIANSNKFDDSDGTDPSQWWL